MAGYFPVNICDFAYYVHEFNEGFVCSEELVVSGEVVLNLENFRDVSTVVYILDFGENLLYFGGEHLFPLLESLDEIFCGGETG